MTEVLLPLATLVLGAAFGFGSSLALASLRQRHTLSLRILDQYFEVRKDLVEMLSDLTVVNLREGLSDAQRVEYRDLVSKMFYKHYDFLPEPVLEALMQLHMCLADSKGRLYAMEGNGIVPMAAGRVEEFVQECSLFENGRVLAPIAMASRSAEVRRNHAVSLHTRFVLQRLNRYASLENLIKMIAKLRKAR